MENVIVEYASPTSSQFEQHYSHFETEALALVFGKNITNICMATIEGIIWII